MRSITKIGVFSHRGKEAFHLADAEIVLKMNRSLVPPPEAAENWTLPSSGAARGSATDLAYVDGKKI
jgi:hypothetical protein